MKSIRYALLPGLVALCIATPADARLGATIEELRKELIMSQFHISKLGTLPPTPGKEYVLRPPVPGLEDLLTLKLWFDKDAKLEATELWMQDAYLPKDPEFAREFAATFISSQVHKQDSAVMSHLANEILYRNDSPTHHFLGEVPPIPEKPTAGFTSFAEKGDFRQTLEHSTLTIERVTLGEVLWVRLRIAKK